MNLQFNLWLTGPYAKTEMKRVIETLNLLLPTIKDAPAQSGSGQLGECMPPAPAQMLSKKTDAKIQKILNKEQEDNEEAESEETEEDFEEETEESEVDEDEVSFEEESDDEEDEAKPSKGKITKPAKPSGAKNSSSSNGKVPTLNGLIKKAKVYLKANGRKSVVELLRKQFKVDSIHDLDEKHYKKLFALLDV